MRKFLPLVLFAVLFGSGCVMTDGNAIKGMILTDVTGPKEIHLPRASASMVEGRAMCSGIVGVVSGDCSYEAALKDALSKTDATALQDIVVDYHEKNIFMIFGEYTTIVRGVPVK